MGDLQVINMSYNGALRSIDILIGNTPVILIYNKVALLEAARQLLPEEKRCLQSPVHGNVHTAIYVCLPSSLVDVFLICFGRNLGQ